MQDFIILATIRTEKHFSILLDLKSDKVKGARNVSQGHRVKVCACRACQGQLLCKVS